MHEIMEIDLWNAFLFALVLAFGVVAFISGLILVKISPGKGRTAGFLQMLFGWIALFIIPLFLWNLDFLLITVMILLGGLVGLVAALLILFGLLMKT